MPVKTRSKKTRTKKQAEPLWGPKPEKPLWRHPEAASEKQPKISDSIARHNFYHGTESLLDIARNARPFRKRKSTDAWPSDLLAELDEVIQSVIRGDITVGPMAIAAAVNARLEEAGLPRVSNTTLLKYWGERKRELLNGQKAA